jgi:hypothetical protein
MAFLNFSAKKVAKFLIILWILFSLGYIVWDLGSDFKVRVVNRAYQAGRQDTINQLINQAQACQPIQVFNQERQVTLINQECLPPQEE